MILSFWVKSLLETGLFDGLATGHPYLTIVEEMENFAKTN